MGPKPRKAGERARASGHGPASALTRVLPLLACLGCSSREAPLETVRTGVGSHVPAAPVVGAPAPPPPSVTLLAGGDVSFGRDVGQTLLERPSVDFFTELHELLVTADVVFANLESPLSDQHGETQSRWVPLAFNGPPAGADALARIGVTFVSTANNHAWDYGKKGLLETMANLERAGIGFVGTGRTRAEAYAPWIGEKNGVRIGALAVTDIWNQVLSPHPGAEHVAGADAARLSAAVRELRASGRVDVVVVSHHGGGEYLEQPLPRTKKLLHAAVDAGADLVLGHHPHVVQGVEWYRGRPIVYSLGNLMMQMSDGRPPPSGMLARVRLEPRAAVGLEICPLVFAGPAPRMLGGSPDPDAALLRFADGLRRISKPLGGVALGPPTLDGCMAASTPEERDARAEAVAAAAPPPG